MEEERIRMFCTRERNVRLREHQVPDHVLHFNVPIKLSFITQQEIKLLQATIDMTVLKSQYALRQRALIQKWVLYSSPSVARTLT